MDAFNTLKQQVKFLYTKLKCLMDEIGDLQNLQNNLLQIKNISYNSDTEDFITVLNSTVTEISEREILVVNVTDTSDDSLTKYISKIGKGTYGITNTQFTLNDLEPFNNGTNQSGNSFPGFTDLPTDYNVTLGDVATSNDYNDLDNLPSIPSGINNLQKVLDEGFNAESNNTFSSISLDLENRHFVFKTGVAELAYSLIDLLGTNITLFSKKGDAESTILNDGTVSFKIQDIGLGIITEYEFGLCGDGKIKIISPLNLDKSYGEAISGTNVFHTPLIFTDGSTHVTAEDTGIVDLSSLLSIDNSSQELQTSSTIVTSRNILATDANGLNDCTSATDITITIVDDTTLNLPIGFVAPYKRSGDGNVIITAGSGVTAPTYQTYSKDDVISIRKTAANTWEFLNPPKAINSTTVGEPSGSDQVFNIVSLTQAEYDAGTPVATTLYNITDA